MFSFIEPIEVTKDLTYEESPIQIIDHRLQQLHNKHMQLVKVLWAKHISSEATWETEEEMRAKYPHLFEVTLLLTRLISFVDDTFKGGGCNSSPLDQVYLSTYSFIYLHIYLFKEAYSSNYVVFIYFCDCIYLFNYIMFVHFSHSCI